MPDRPKVLVPIQILKGESIPDGIPELLTGAHVVLLGYYEVPDQTAPGQARVQFEDRALDRLEELTAIIEAAGAESEHRLVFTHDVQTTINRFILDEGCEAVLVPRSTKPPESALVAVRGTVGIDRLSRVVTGLFGPLETTITLFHVVSPDESEADATLLLEGIVERIIDGGISSDHIEIDIVRGKDPLDEIVDRVDNFDVLVMGESDPSLATFVFGMAADQVAEKFLGPTIVVQREPTESDDTDE